MSSIAAIPSTHIIQGIKLLIPVVTTKTDNMYPAVWACSYEALHKGPGYIVQVWLLLKNGIGLVMGCHVSLLIVFDFSGILFSRIGHIFRGRQIESSTISLNSTCPMYLNLAMEGPSYIFLNILIVVVRKNPKDPTYSSYFNIIII